MISLVNGAGVEMENSSAAGAQKAEAAELLGAGLSSSSDSLDSPSFSHFQAPKQKRKVRFKKPFRSVGVRSSSRRGPGSAHHPRGCRLVEGAKILCCFSLVALVVALLWYVSTLGQRIQELQDKFQDIEAGNRNTPEALHMQHSKLKLLESNVTALYKKVGGNTQDIDNITAEVRRLKEVSGELKESLAAAPALQELPKNVHALSESLVSFGAKLNALESNLKELKDQQGQVATNAQNLSGDLEALKMLVQEWTNSSDVQSRVNGTSVRDVKSAVQETNHQVHVLEEKLLSVVQSIRVMNGTLASLPPRVDTIQEAVAFISNDTRNTRSLLSTLENFIDTNLTLRMEQPLDINRTISESLLQLVRKDVLTVNGSLSDSPLRQTHDVLLLLAAMLRKFERVPKESLRMENATEVVEGMLREAFEEMIASRDDRMKEMDSEIKHLTAAASSHPPHAKESGDLTTPFFVQSPKGGNTSAAMIPPL